MGSKLLCICGDLLRINLHEGNGLSLLVNEELTDMPTDEGTPCGALLDLIVRESRIVATCRKCGALSVIDSDLNIQRFAPV